MKMRTQLMLGYLVVFALMVGIAGVMFQGNASVAEREAWVDHTQEVLAKRGELLLSVVDMETGLRGFALTGDEAFLEPYRRGRTAFLIRLAQMKTLVAANPSQVAKLEAIGLLVERWRRTVAGPLISALRGSKGPATGDGKSAAVEHLKRGAGKVIIDQFRAHAASFEAVERRLLRDRREQAAEATARSTATVIAGTVVAILLGLVALFWTTRRVLRQVGGEPAAIAAVADRIAEGDLEIELGADAERGAGIRASVARMLAALRENRDQSARADWLKTGVARLNELMSGDPAIDELSAAVITEIADYLGAQVGALYLMRANGDSDDSDGAALALTASYAYTRRKSLSNRFALGEGLVGQAALEGKQILLQNVPEDYVLVSSGLGERVPRALCVTPFRYEGRVKGVVEIGTLGELGARELEYLAQVMPNIAIAIQSAESRENLSAALERSQLLSEELQTQQEELRVSNEELEEQTQRLEESEQRLKVRQEELQVTNEELEEKNQLLDRQKREVDLARQDVERKAEEAALASKYKSEFLANMSHELRTPLNSLLLLSQDLAGNKTGNLTDEQVDAVKIIHGGGSDLLNLINEILDLAKIEAGRMDLQLGAVRSAELAERVRTGFTRGAEEKGLQLEIVTESDCPAEIVSDGMRVDQILKNLLSNAIKFTDSGTVQVTFGRGAPADSRGRSTDVAGSAGLAIAVRDTGIGIAPDQQRVIFEAFQQADGGTARRYGGTGLGLSISRELAQLLGGEIQLESAPGAGSTFTLYLPLSAPGAALGSGATKTETATATRAKTAAIAEPAAAGPTASEPAALAASAPTQAQLAALQIDDDREHLGEGDRAILVIEDDPRFAQILRKKCHDKGFKCLAAPSGELGLALARAHLPCAILLDIHLPGMDGWAVLSTLKEDLPTRHIPVHMISAEDASAEALQKGAVGYATKPIAQQGLEQAFAKLEQFTSGKDRHLLVIEDDDALRRSMVELIGNGDLFVDEAGTGEEALVALRAQSYDCVVLDLTLPDMSGLAVLQTLEREEIPIPPVIIHTARELTREEENELREHAESIVIKDVRSQERLLDEVSLFLHRVVSQMPEAGRRIIRDLHDTDELLRDKRVLIVDDDMRTLFAMSQSLAGSGMQPLKANDGQRALDLLREHPDIDLVLMDIMMPGMDGYQAMREIRAEPRFQQLPIIALTAKAMKEDRAKCIAAGANDYMSKPVDQERLLSMMRIWLYR